MPMARMKQGASFWDGRDLDKDQDSGGKGGGKRKLAE